MKAHLLSLHNIEHFIHIENTRLILFKMLKVFNEFFFENCRLKIPYIYILTSNQDSLWYMRERSVNIEAVKIYNLTFVLLCFFFLFLIETCDDYRFIGVFRARLRLGGSGKCHRLAMVSYRYTAYWTSLLLSSKNIHHIFQVS